MLIATSVKLNERIAQTRFFHFLLCEKASSQAHFLRAILLNDGVFLQVDANF